jgi:hypothetical protein
MTDVSFETEIKFVIDTKFNHYTAIELMSKSPGTSIRLARRKVVLYWCNSPGNYPPI